MFGMTSRRKQVKPIKAQSNQISVQNQFAISEMVYQPQDQMIRPEIATILVKEELSEQPILKKEIDYVSAITKMEFEETKVACNSNSLMLIDGISEDISKKSHKDDAKILPFETNGGIDIFQCPICHENSICGRENLTCHLQEHQNKTKRDDGKHLCCLCSKELSSNSSLERHLLTHSNHRPFSCILCDKKFTTNGNLSRHIKTSHNNNGTIDCSIEEVIKKHQLDTSSSINTDVNTTKFKKSHKPSRKEPLNMELLGLKGCTMNFMSSPLSFLDRSTTDCNTYQQIIQGQSSNINLLSPFYSFNVNDLGYIRANLSNNYNVLPQASLSILSSKINNATLEGPIRGKSLKRKHLDSLLQNRLLITRRYRKKIDCHIRNVNQIKKIIFSTNSIQCVKCHKRMLLTTSVMSHIRFCYRKHNQSNLFCPFKLCSKKYSTLKKLLKHIKNVHLDTFYQSIEPVSPPLEPLNLSVKDSTTRYPSSMHDQIPILSQCNLQQSRTCDNILDLSGSFSESVISNSLDFTQQCQAFQTINQFISSPSIVTLSPFQFSNPITLSTPSLIAKPSSVPIIVSNSQLQVSTPWHGTISSFGAIKSFPKAIITNDSESSTSNSVSNSLCTKYSPAIKKKNSYKDAPKLITCPMDGCVQKFPWNSSLMRHILTHTAHKPFKCTRCVKSFSTKSNRERHMTRVHRVRINRLKFKSLQASRSAIEDSSKTLEDGVDSENGADAMSTQDNDLRIIELSEEEWIIMDDNDRRAEDISSNLLKLAGQPIIEPNPVRMNNAEKKIEGGKCEAVVKKIISLPNEPYLYLDHNCT